MTLSDFFQMSGYAPYVWSCYGLTLVVLVGMDWAARRRLREELQRARRRATLEQSKS